MERIATLNSGRIQINLNPLEEAQSNAPRRSSAGLQPEACQSVAGITLFMQPVQDLTVEDRG